MGKNARVRHGVKVIDSGAAPRTGMKTAKTSLITLVVVPSEVMVVVACDDESV